MRSPSLQNIVIIVLTMRGFELAKALSIALPGSTIHGKTDRVENADKNFSDTLKHINSLFKSGRPIIGICAAGILIRAIGPELKLKQNEPPVVAVSEEGRSIVSLLGGHNGANDLTTYLASVTGGHAAITTAGDLMFGLALDDPPEGWHIANPKRAKSVMAGLLSGKKIALNIETGDPAWLTKSSIPISDDGELIVKVTAKKTTIDDPILTFYPSVLSLGIGCERNTNPEEIIKLVEKSLKQFDYASEAIACVASLDIKMDDPAIGAVAEYLGVPARFFSAKELESLTPRLANPSKVVFAEVGCHGVAEGAALAASGDNGFLVIKKIKSKRATVAVAQSPSNINPNKCGQRRGRLNVVGIGPGKDDWRTPAATNAIARSSHIVGYSRYLELIGNLVGSKKCHISRISEEKTRTRKALDLAAEGFEVSLICSGDAGIYALATLVFELVDIENRDTWNRIDIQIEPGVSAFQAAASRAGAPIGHDFCSISLSDLLTPWEQIEQRVVSAARGDFVVAFYNPVSKRRSTQLGRARQILLTYRSQDTPVVLARNLGRVNESIQLITLATLKSRMADMLTIVIIGNSQSRFMNQARLKKLYTPRGYLSKNSLEADS